LPFLSLSLWQSETAWGPYLKPCFCYGLPTLQNSHHKSPIFINYRRSVIATENSLKHRDWGLGPSVWQYSKCAGEEGPWARHARLWILSTWLLRSIRVSSGRDERQSPFEDIRILHSKCLRDQARSLHSSCESEKGCHWLWWTGGRPVKNSLL
jgi:hypothetical protein